MNYHALLLVFAAVSLAAEDTPSPPTEPEHHRALTFQEQVLAEDRKLDVVERQVVALERKEQGMRAAFVDAWIRHADLGLARIDQDATGTEMGQRLARLNQDILQLRSARNAIVYPRTEVRSPPVGGGYPPGLGQQRAEAPPPGYSPSPPRSEIDSVWGWFHGDSIGLFLATRGQDPDPGPVPPPSAARPHPQPVPASDPPLPPVQLGLPGTPGPVHGYHEEP